MRRKSHGDQLSIPESKKVATFDVVVLIHQLICKMKQKRLAKVVTIDYKLLVKIEINKSDSKERGRMESIIWKEKAVAHEQITSRSQHSDKASRLSDKYIKSESRLLSNWRTGTLSVQLLKKKDNRHPVVCVCGWEKDQCQEWWSGVERLSFVGWLEHTRTELWGGDKAVECNRHRQ